jgi:hypothetical protein
VVAVASPGVEGTLASPRRARAWGLAAAGVLVVGMGVRLALGAGGTGDRSAVIMAAMLITGAWLTAMLVGTPRLAFGVTLGLVALFDLAALPSRSEPAYDSREAFFRTDQSFSAQVSAPPTGAPNAMLLTLPVEPVFPVSASQPKFGLAGEVGGASLEWDCTFSRGLQTVALPVPPSALASAGPVDVRLHLTGAPSRETDYLLAYASAAHGGFLMSVVPATDVGADATLCAVR